MAWTVPDDTNGHPSKAMEAAATSVCQLMAPGAISVAEAASAAGVCSSRWEAVRGLPLQTCMNLSLWTLDGVEKLRQAAFVVTFRLRGRHGRRQKGH